MKKNVKLMYFYAYWDGCMEYKKQFIELCEQHDIYYDLVDCETDNGVKLSCDYNVKNCPTILCIKNGRIVAKGKGNNVDSFIENIVKKY